MFRLISLQRLLRDKNFDYEKFISTFSCRLEELNDFVKNNAVRYEKENRARSYFIINTSNNVSKSAIMAFFSVSNSFLVDITSVSKSLYKDLKKSSKNDEFQNFPGVLSTFLIGQLGRNACYTHNEISGVEILNFAVSIIIESFEFTGGQAICVECEEYLVDFYKRNGFVHFNTNKNGLHQMIIKIKNLIRE